MSAEVADDTGYYIAAGLPSDGLQRLNGLSACGLLDAAVEQALSGLVRLAALCCEVPVALISLSDCQGRIVRRCHAASLSRRERRAPQATYACAEPALVVAVPDARSDSRFAGNPLLITEPGLAFMAVVPLVSRTGGEIGALYIADYRQRDLSERQSQMLAGMAAQVMEQIELRGNVMLLEQEYAAQLSFVEQMKREQQELQKQNATDPLTGLGNRRSFHDRVCLEIARAESTGTSAALMLFDVDHFKSYNDSFGHPAGDVLLKQLADLVLHSCREEDFAARVGGEEFAVLLPGTPQEGALAFSSWLRRRVERQVWPHRPVTISAGVAVAAAGEQASQLVARADAALYRSKRGGRNQVTLSETPAPF